jgi:soluble lytic murein transglycosylase-like protein
MRHSAIKVMALVAVVGLLAPVVASPSPAEADDLDRTRNELDTVVQNIDRVMAELDAIADQIEAIDRRLGTANAELARIRDELAQAENGIAQAEADEQAALELLAIADARLAEVEAEILSTRARLQGRLVHTFKYGRTTTADLVMRGTVGALNLHDMAVNLATVERLTGDDRDLVAGLESLAAEQLELIDTATAARTAAVAARDAAVEQRDRVAQLETQQRATVNEISADRNRRRAIFAALEADKDQLAALAAALTDQIRRLELSNLSVLTPVGGVFTGTPSWAPRLPTAGQPYAGMIASAGATQGIDGRLLAALVWTESWFRPNAVSSAGAAGLAQLMPATARSLGLRVDSTVDERFDPVLNVNAGGRYLRQQIVRFGSVDLGLAAYNAGPGNVIKYGGIPPFPETQFYVYIVMRRYEQIVG